MAGLEPKIYKILIAYDGTDFFGWQQQAVSKTVAGTLEQVFQTIYSVPVRITGSSRTDAGVHALGQVATFTSTINVEPAAMMRTWNYRLPPSIQIRSLEIAADKFHPQHNVAHKTYHYYLCRRRPLPMVARYAWFYRYAFDPKKLHDALQLFVGTHDFKNFCTMQEGDLRPTQRTINSIELHYIKRYNLWRITVCGKSFLHYMIRRIVGAALHVSRHDKLPLHTISDALADKPGHIAGIMPKAPPQGLLLRRIRYRDRA